MLNFNTNFSVFIDDSSYFLFESIHVVICTDRPYNIEVPLYFCHSTLFYTILILHWVLLCFVFCLFTVIYIPFLILKYLYFARFASYFIMK